ncbi:Glycosyl transferase, ALG6/ALG8 [Dillenia turbinata]|uniref:Alpha-1,3-glucosyltransferase n=1 Tax=Dillenia turbinata TaxID=194707 RepID=A0AAN8V3S0_9MAGN
MSYIQMEPAKRRTKYEKAYPKVKKPFSDLFWCAGIATCIKLLLIPSYHSTDFEVHRNWLALTHSLPLSRWYFDSTSPWTLDYPPLFAFFERLLSTFAHFVDPQIVHLQDGLNYSSPTAVLFQRLSVIVSDVSLFYGTYRLARNWDPKTRNLMWVLVFFSPGLLIVDHVHFQYNGFLLGILLLSLSFLEEGRDLMGGFLFAILLCFKHLFAVAAPLYFVYLLRHYCWNGSNGYFKGILRLLSMGSVVAAVFAAAFTPFLYHDHAQIQQILRRLFPFGRGLCHAYWAPNFWVFYIALDKGLAFLLTRLGFDIQVPSGSFTGGLVGDSSPFAILPRITPFVTFIMVLISMSPSLVIAWRNPQPRMITRWVPYAYTCSFLFGWHVHEKASLHFVIPLSFVAIQSIDDMGHYFLLSIVSYYSLFPLLYEAQEYPVKLLLLLLYSAVMWFGFSLQSSELATVESNKPLQKGDDKSGLQGSSNATRSDGGWLCMGWLDKGYLLGILFVEMWGQILQPFLLGNKLPFLPLMMISVYCGLGIMYSWIWQLRRIIVLAL